jgi:hypothetical protein
VNDERPNVLLICTDHWPGMLTRPAGHREVMTPTLLDMAGGAIPSNVEAEWVGEPDRQAAPPRHRDLAGQRGIRFV